MTRYKTKIVKSTKYHGRIPAYNLLNTAGPNDYSLEKRRMIDSGGGKSTMKIK